MFEFLFAPAARAAAKAVAPEAVAGVEATASRWIKAIASKFGSKAAQVAPEAGATAHTAETAAKPLTHVEQATALIKANPVTSATTVAVGANVVEGKVNPEGKEHSMGERALMGTTEFAGGVATAVKATKFLPGILKVLALPIGWAVGSRIGEGVGLATVQSTNALKELDKATSPAAQATTAPATTTTKSTTEAPAAGGAGNPAATAGADTGLAAQQTERLTAEAGYAAAVRDVMADIGKSGTVTAEHRAKLTVAVETVTKAEATALGRDANDQGVKALVAAMGQELVSKGTTATTTVSDTGVAPQEGLPGADTRRQPALVPHAS